MGFVWSVHARASTAELPLGTKLRNFREVDPGLFYRSGQLSPAQLAEAIDLLGIRTVINLRGPAREGDRWLKRERRVTRKKQVDLVTVRFSARSIPRREELVRLLDAYRDAERPILVHCRDGTDRSGEAAAIYQMEYMGLSRAEALAQLSLAYFHVSWLRPAMRYFVERYQGEDWARSAYDPCDPGYDFYDQARYCGS